jgi:hypothetical protein
MVIGQLLFGTFQFFLFDREGRNPQRIGPPENTNVDSVADLLEVPGTPEDLNGCRIWWQCGLASPTGQPNESFAVTIKVHQNGQVVGLDGQTGTLAKPIVEGVIRLRVQEQA